MYLYINIYKITFSLANIKYLIYSSIFSAEFLLTYQKEFSWIRGLFKSFLFSSLILMQKESLQKSVYTVFGIVHTPVDQWPRTPITIDYNKKLLNLSEIIFPNLDSFLVSEILHNAYFFKIVGTVSLFAAFGVLNL